MTPLDRRLLLAVARVQLRATGEAVFELRQALAAAEAAPPIDENITEDERALILFTALELANARAPAVPQPLLAGPLAIPAQSAMLLVALADVVNRANKRRSGVATVDPV